MPCEQLMKSKACMPSMLISSTRLMPLPPSSPPPSACPGRPAETANKPAANTALRHNIGMIRSPFLLIAGDMLGAGHCVSLTVRLRLCGAGGWRRVRGRIGFDQQDLAVNDGVPLRHRLAPNVA